jgi:hypothetical protein
MNIPEYLIYLYVFKGKIKIPIRLLVSFFANGGRFESVPNRLLAALLLFLDKR